MLRVGDVWSEEILQPFRGQGYFKFFWFPEFDPLLKEYSHVNKYTLEEYIEGTVKPVLTSVYNGYTLGNRTIDMSGDRWVLDGSRHTRYYNNQYSSENYTPRLNEDMVLNIKTKPSNQPSAEDPRSFLLTDQYGINSYEEFHSIYPQPVCTDKIWILWDVANKAGPYKFHITMTYSDGTSATRAITNYEYNYISCIDLVTRKKINSIDLKIYSWTLPNESPRISQIGFGELITSDSEEISISSINIEKSVSLINNENSIYKCTIIFDNTSNYFNPLDPDNIANKIKIGSPFYNIWEMDTVEHDHLCTDIESWRIISTETLTDSKEFKLILGFEGDLIKGDYFPEITVWDQVPLLEWFLDALNYGRKIGKLSKLYYPYTEEEYVNNSSIVSEGYADIWTVQDSLRYIAQAFNKFISKGRMGAAIRINSIADTGRIIPEICLLNHPKITSGEDISGISINSYRIDKTNFKSRIDLTLQTSQVNKNLIVSYGTWSDPNTQGNDKSYNIVGVAGPLHASTVGGAVEASSGRQALVSIDRVDEDNAEAYFEVSTGLESFKTINVTIKKDAAENIITIDNKFITSGNLYNDCINYLKKLLINSRQIEVNTTGVPELEPGDIVIINTELGNFKVIITKTTLEFNGGFSGNLSGKILEEVL